MSKTGLVLEGGGMRGVYTAGVLDSLLDQHIRFDYIIGVSAGACHGISFLSGQKGRTRRINLDYCRDRRYASFSNFIRTGSMFGMDFVFDEIPMRLEPFDYETFRRDPAEFVIGVTEMKTGRPLYFYKKDYCGCGTARRLNWICRASSAIPFFSRPVSIDGRDCLDGGTSDPIPFRKALADGCGRIVAVLTRDRSYVKKPEGHRLAYRRMFRRSPEMARCVDIRHIVYNDDRRRLFELEKEGRALVIAPDKPVTIGRFEHSRGALDALYREGVENAGALAPALRAFVENG